METIEEKILHYLKTHCSGIGYAITADELSSIFGITDRELRQIKRNIVLNIDARVGSCSTKGYYYCSNDSELRIARSEYVKRIVECKAMVDRYDGELESKGQKELF